MSLQPESNLLRVEHVAGVAVVKVVVSALDEANVQAIGEALFAVADSMACPRLRLDLAQVLFLTSTALGKLMALHKRVRAAGGHLALVNVYDHVYEVFDVTRLVQVLDVRRGPGDLPGLASMPPLAC
jgi:anti-sigma B factor antagonist